MPHDGDEPTGGEIPDSSLDNDDTEHPDQIGPYRILRVLGEGGMGVVYEAEQVVPMTRRVALKVIKLGMDTKHVVARFEVERQALAVMDHQGIAKVYEAGTTEAGRPYIAMEHVRGIPITEYCDNSKLSTADRLELFVALCQAIQHAHQKGVIHRDLKPSNILVTEQDGKPVPKVIDFGIAKAVGRRLTDRTLVTEFGQAIGTPAYMSPEQAEMSGLDVDTRTDVYSLGVILYELLVGAVPIDPHEVGIHGFIAQLVLRETNPPTPSSRISSLGAEKDFVAKQRHTDPGALRRELRGDLDWITMKALDSDRSKRYDTANGLASDVERHLRNEPVLARGPSATYRASRFVARHKAGVSFAVVLLLILIVTSIFMTVSRGQAVRAEAQARLEVQKSTAINDFLQRMLASANPWVGAREIKVADVLDQAAAEINETFADQPEVESAVRLTVGRTYRGLGLLEEAEQQLREALLLLRSTLPEGDPGVADGIDDLAKLLLLTGEYDEAETILIEAYGIRLQRFGYEHPDVASSLSDLASVHTYTGDYVAADSLFRESLDMRTRLLGERHLDVAETMNNLAAFLFATGKYDEAESLFRSTLLIRRDLQGEEHLDVTEVMNNLAMTLVRLERYDEADSLYRDALEIQRGVLGDDHPEVARSLNNLAAYLRRKGEYDEAEPLISEALAINRRVLGDVNPEVAANLNNLALILRGQGELDAAEQMLGEVLAIDRAILGDDHPQHASTLRSMASIQLQNRRYQTAERSLREAVTIERKSFAGDSWQVATTESMLGDCLIRMQRYAEAEPLLVATFDVIRAEFGDEHGRTRAALGRVIALYEATGDSVKAAEYRALRPTG